MPTYEYVCKNKDCSEYNKSVDIVKSIYNADSEEKCFKCSEVMIKNCVPFAFKMKGVQADYRDFKYSFSTNIKKEGMVDYEYVCNVCNKKVMIKKDVELSDRKEKCEDCGNIMGKVYSFAWRWGKGSRPDSDRRKQQMVDAHERDDYAEMERLQLHYDSSGGYVFSDKEEKKEVKLIGGETKRDYEYTCDNVECIDYRKEIVINKQIKLSSEQEKCNKCGEQLRRIFGVGGITIR